MYLRKKVLFGVIGIFAGLGLLPLSLAFADSSSLSIQSLVPGSSVNVGNEVSFTLVPSSFTSGNAVTYSVSDTLSGSTVTSGDINSNGVFSWIPTQADAGQHTITVTGSDGASSASVSQSINVIGTPAVSIQSLSPGSQVSPNTTVTFTAVPTSFQTSPVYTITDNANYTTVNSTDINSSGQFSWTPTTADIGQHTITVQVTDSNGDSANIAETIVVQSSGSLSLVSINPGMTVSVGSPLSFTATPNGFTATSYAVSDSFPNSSVSTSNIAQSGYFVWTPTANDAGTHTVTVSASNSASSQNFSTSTLITVVSAQPVAPTTTVVAPTVVAAPAYVFSVYLKPGSQGADVSELQRILIKDGYLTVAATGYYGSLTEAGVIAYQAAHEIDQLGVVGPATRAALNAEESSSSSGSGNAALIAQLLQELQVLEAKIATLQASGQY